MSLRGIATGWLALIVLQVVVTQRGADATSGILNTLNSLIQRALDPTVAGIPDRGEGTFTKGPIPKPGGKVGDDFPTLPAPDGGLGGGVGGSQVSGTGGGNVPRAV